MSGASTGTPFDWGFFALERPAFRHIAELSNGILTVLLIMIAGAILIAAFNLPTLWKAVLLSWLVLP